MKPVSLHPPSLVAGCCLAGIAFLAMAQAPAPAARSCEYRLVDDPSQEVIEKLAEEGWEYAGYLGEGKKGTGNDETLWKRPTK